ncbi:MAG: thymidylate synthase [Methylococcales bacterium]
MIKTGEEQYLELMKKVIDEGVWIKNKRTGVRCKTIIGHTIILDTANDAFPMITTRKVGYKFALAEFLGYLKKGESSAARFRELGTKTWDANANENKDWLANPNRKGEDDMGYCYGEVGRKFRNLDGTTFDQLKKIVDDLKKGIDDRGEILTFWHPNTSHLACLRPCLHTHTFSILGDTLHLTSSMRSTDVALGLVANIQQVVMFLRLMAQMAGLKSGRVKFDMVNIHLYEQQYSLALEHVKRKPFAQPQLKINPDIKTLEDLDDWVSVNDFTVEGYNEFHPPIKYPFTV